MNLIDPWVAGYVWGKYGDWGRYPYDSGDLEGNPITDSKTPKAVWCVMHPQQFGLYESGVGYGAMQIPHYLTNVIDLRGNRV